MYLPDDALAIGAVPFQSYDRLGAAFHIAISELAIPVQPTLVNNHGSPGKRDGHLLRGCEHAKTERSRVIGGGSAKKCILNCASFERSGATRIAAHLQHFQVAIDIQSVFPEQVAKALIGGRTEARDAREFTSEVGNRFNVRMHDEIGRKPRQRVAEDGELD